VEVLSFKTSQDSIIYLYKEGEIKTKMMSKPIYNWKRLLSLSGISGILVVLIIINQIEIIPRVYSVTTNAQNATTSPNASSVAAVVIITKNEKGNLIFKPQTLTIKPGEEVFIGNNDTSPHSLTNGISSNDPLSGKLFDTGIIKARGFAEFVASNLNPGRYQFYSITDPSLKGEIIVVSEK
jgi:plastocyanin